MMQAQEILFFDLETSAIAENHAVFQWAYASGEIRQQGEDLGGLLEPFAQARWVCAHNLLAHDATYLPKHPETNSFLAPGQEAIDTLYLSALLFPQHPYHRMVKDYRLHSPHNNPAADVGLLQNLFWDCVQAWELMPQATQAIYLWLLQASPAFAGFFSWLAQQVQTDERHTIEQASSLIPAWNVQLAAQAIQAQFKGQACQNWQEITRWLGEEPETVAYVLALMRTTGLPSILPPWLVQRFPRLSRLLWLWRGDPCAHPECAYCQQHLDPHVALKNWFGFEQFRSFEGVSLQEEIVRASLRGESFLAILPTSAGKSLTFQLPALMQGEALRALTVVISPLQSLMKDQVDNLEGRFEIAGAVTLNGSLSPVERKLAIEKVQSGEASILYISPESLRSNTILRLLKERSIARFVIDEAHCFSEWGQDFRVDYLYLARFLKYLQDSKHLEAPIPVSCFTATAKHAVQMDILNYFKARLQLDLRLFQSQARRSNLRFQVFAANKSEKLQELRRLLSERTGPKIVYASTTAGVEALAQSLQQSGLTARAYHGQMDAEMKQQNMDAFMQGEIEVMVATSAFGMGVDKDNVSMVIHYEISDSLEDYMQEAGRAGRRQDIDAACYVLYDEADLSRHFMLLNSQKLNQKEIDQIWAGLKKQKQSSLSLSTLEIAKAAGWDLEQKQLETRVKTAVAALEEAELLERHQNATLMLAGYFAQRPLTEATALIEASCLLSEAEQLHAKRVYQYLQSRSSLSQAKASQQQDLRFDWMCEHLGLETELVHRLLNALRQAGLVRTKALQEAVLFTGRKVNTSSRLRLMHLLQLEKAWIENSNYSETNNLPYVTQISLKSLNTQLKNQDIASSLEDLRCILKNLWPASQVQKNRRNREHEEYLLHFKMSWTQWRDLRLQIQAQLLMALDFLDNLPKADEATEREGEKPVSFSLEDFHRAFQLIAPDMTLHQADQLLLRLHRLNIIRLEGGSALYYTRLQLNIKGSRQQKFTQSHYQHLKTYYSHKVEQIHFVREYAERMLQNHQDALNFVEDYFHIPYAGFVKKYFPKLEDKSKLKQSLTPRRFQQIFGALSEEQLAIIKDQEHERILVAAGPGSGKTRILVHKVAALLMLEEVKPEQFLLLTYSRPAAQEMRQRLVDLLGYKPHQLDVATFHSYAFQLLEQQGEVHQLEQVIEQATEAIQHELLPQLSRLEAKSVILVDEYQDISQKEYAFLKAIIEVAQQAGDLRVMVVGDDDQNIYAFRGSSTRFMREFAHDFGAQVYYLSTNYRAGAALVAQSNAFVRVLKERIKEGHPLLAKREEAGEIQAWAYARPQFFEPLLRQLQQSYQKGSTAVLCTTNQEAHLLTHLLQEAGLPARLLMDLPHFRLAALLEIELFSFALQDGLQLDHGLITPERWQTSYQRVIKYCRGSQALSLFEQILKQFQEGRERLFLSDWQHWIHEMRWEDLYDETLFTQEEKGLILVSTMHKAKGKEFDHVYLYVDDSFKAQDPSWQRVMYVALTRARHRLFIHGAQSFFASFAEIFKAEDYVSPYVPPLTLVTQLGLKDIMLGVAKNCQGELMRLVAGCQLQVWDVGLLRETRTGMEIRLSRKAQEEWRKMIAQGYRPSSAELGYMAIWWDKQEQRKYRIPLPEVTWVKREAESTFAAQ